MASIKYKDPETGKFNKITSELYLGLDVPIGTVLPFAGNQVPDGYLVCDGSILNKNDYPDLYSVIGDFYWVNKSTHAKNASLIEKEYIKTDDTFMLPNLCIRMPLGLGRAIHRDDAGNNVGGWEVELGDTNGELYHKLTINEMPSHNHPISRPRWYAGETGKDNWIYGSTSTTTQVSSNMSSISSTGGDDLHNNVQPYVGMNYIIKAYNKYRMSSLVGVVDGLWSTDYESALSAKQGKILDDKITGLKNKTEFNFSDYIEDGIVVNSSNVTLVNNTVMLGLNITKPAGFDANTAVLVATLPKEIAPKVTYSASCAFHNAGSTIIAGYLTVFTDGKITVRTSTKNFSFMCNLTYNI